MELRKCLLIFISVDKCYVQSVLIDKEKLNLKIVKALEFFF